MITKIGTSAISGCCGTIEAVKSQEPPQALIMTSDECSQGARRERVSDWIFLRKVSERQKELIKVSRV